MKKKIRFSLILDILGQWMTEEVWEGNRRARLSIPRVESEFVLVESRIAEIPHRSYTFIV